MVPLVAKRGQEGDGREAESERWGDWMEDWRALMGEDEKSRLMREVEGEKAKRLKAEGEVQRWKELSGEMYRICALHVMKQAQGGQVESSGVGREDGRGGR